MNAAPLSSSPSGSRRNEPCACGSGLKYKKCCAGRDDERRRDDGKRQILESVLRRFFENHPRPAEQKSLSAWKREMEPGLKVSYGAEKTDSIIGDTFFFGQSVGIWNEFVGSEARNDRNAAAAEALSRWVDPRFAVLHIVPAGSAARPEAAESAGFAAASELLTGETLRLRTDDTFRPQPGTLVIGFWIPGLDPAEPLAPLNSLVSIEDPEEAPLLQLEERFRTSGQPDTADFYRSNFAAVYEMFGDAQSSAGSPDGTLPPSITAAIERLEGFLIERDLKNDRLMDVFFRFLKRRIKRETPDAGTAAAAAVRFGGLRGWLPQGEDFASLVHLFGANPAQAERLAEDMLAFERKTSAYREEEEQIGFRVGTDPEAEEYRQWQLYMHIKDLDIQGEAALRRQMDYFSRIPYLPASREEEAQLRMYEAYLAREEDFRREKLEQAVRLDPDSADVRLMQAETEAEADIREKLLEQAEQAALRSYEPDIQPVWLHLPNRPYMRILLRRAVYELESGRYEAAFRRLYRLLQDNPADHQGARYPALSALIAKGDLDAASGLLGHYGEGSGDNAFYRWFDWAIAYRRDPLGSDAQRSYEAAVEANPYAEKYVWNRPAADPYPRASVVTPRSPEEARLIWTLLRPALQRQESSPS
ncbi:SEC-C domain-containing protein [Saccharibacillus qingshengii]|uniref:SEC-C domain-containing protein n=1 Tax=Saccharibacillus qingshengii TaxID=1763540 RepID=UPI0015528111|nr:SEC-C domain-containing protein [Saccharibacillus qingshengii]